MNISSTPPQPRSVTFSTQTPPVTPHDDSSTSAAIYGTINFNPQSPHTTLVALTASMAVVPEVKSGTSPGAGGERFHSESV